jgi:hypothetical protein
MNEADKTGVNQRRVLTCLMIVLVVLAACTQEGKTPASGRPAAGAAVSQQSTGTIQVKMLPESPTVVTDIQAVYSGVAKGTYQWQRNGQVIPGESGDTLRKSLFLKGDTVSVTVASGSAEGKASVVIGNSLPFVVSVPFSPEDVHAGTTITVKPVGQDPDGDEVRFHFKWSINDKELFEDAPVLAGDKIKRGDKVALTILPYDAEGEGTPFISRNIIIPNAAPRIVSNPPQGFQGTVYTYHVVAEDPDGDPIAFSLVSAPPGMTMDSVTGMVTWQISERSSGAHPVEVFAQDPQGMKTTQKYTLTINKTEGEPK